MQTKPWYASMTLWGAIVTAITTLARAFAPDSITEAEVQQFIEALTAAGAGLEEITSIRDGVAPDGDKLLNGSTAVGWVLGMILIVVGRFRASTKVTLTSGP